MRKINLTPGQKKALNIVVTCVQIAIVLITITISIIVLVNPSSGTGEVAEGKVKLLPVLTNSMKGTNKDSFSKHDLVIAQKPKDPKALEVGQIITFRETIGGTVQLNTHRIISKTQVGDEVIYTTKGDNNILADGGVVGDKDVLAVYKYHLKGVGGAIAWLQKPTNFLLVIILPLAVLFIYNVVLFVRILMQAKLAKLEEEKAALLAIDEEEVKRKAIEEYLAKQAQSETPENAADSEE